MSLESPPTLASTWQDPWAAVTSASAAVHMSDDFYGGKGAPFGAHPQGAYIGGHGGMMGVVAPGQTHFGAPMFDPQNNNSHQNNQNLNTSNSDTHSSSSAASSTTTKERKVNFKIDIKAEPQEGVNGGTVDPLLGGQGQPPLTGMQKVPSISDLSDHDSSIDIPCNQVRKILPQK